MVACAPAIPSPEEAAIAEPALMPDARQRRERLLLTAVLLAAALWLGWERWEAYRAIGRAERAHLSGQARALELNLRPQLTAAYLTLRRLQAALVPLPPAQWAQAMAPRLGPLSEALAGVQSIEITDAAGHLLAGDGDTGAPAMAATTSMASMATTVPVDLGPRPSADVLYLTSMPGPGPQPAPARLSLAVLDARGHLAGVLSALLDPAYFGALLSSVLDADDMQGAIAQGGGSLLAWQAAGAADGTNPAGPAGPVTDVPTAETLAWLVRQLHSGQRSSVLSGTAAASSPPRLVAQRILQARGLPLDRPLVLAVSRDLGAVYAPWWRRTAIYGGLYLLLAGAAAAAGARLQRRQAEMRQLARASRRQRELDAERLALALQGGDLALWDLSLPGGETVVNERWFSMLGLAHGECEPGVAGWLSLLHPDDRERALAAQNAHLAGTTPAYQATYRMRHRAGRWLWVLDRGHVVERGAEGQALRMVGTHLDITPQMEAEQALRRSEQSLAVTLYSIGDAVIATDAQGLITRLNAAAAKLVGWSEAEALGRPLAEVFRIRSAAGQPPLHDPVAQVLARGQTVALANDTVLLRRDGSECQIADTAAPIRDAAGQVLGVVLVFSDVTERYRMTQALRDREAQLSNVIDALQGPASRLDGQGRYSFANAAFERWFGMKGAQLLGRDWRTLVRPEAQARVGAWLERAYAGETVNFDHRMPALHGERDVIVTLVPDRDAGGTVQGVFVIAADITERKQADAERQALEGQLREAQKMESIGTLAGGIAHDFNNILAAILGNVALARGDLPPGHAARPSLEQIDRAALRARSLVQQILTFSRRQRNPLRAQPLRPVVDEALALLRATLPAAVRLEPALPEAAVVVEADATQLQQVLVNLCTNAWHALPAGRGRIEIGFEPLADTAAIAALVPGLRPGPAVHLWVRDDGVGMDGATRERIFDPFFTTKPVGQGTGLGLAVVHGIVRHHGGAIRVDSEPGAGSVFHVYLPSVAPPPAAAAAPSAAVPPGRPGRGQRLLYVDDDEVMVLMAQRLLERAGYEVAGAASVAQALAAVAAALPPFELVISDYNMPEGSGLDLAEALRRERPGLPLILSSGYLTDELAARAAQLGVRALLKKENSFEELPALVQSVLAAPPALPA